MSNPLKIQIKNISAKIKFTEHRLDRFTVWEAPKELSKVRAACIASLTHRLNFLRKYKLKNKAYTT